MTLPCTQLSTWIGWTTGLLLLDRPYGIPKFTKWISVSGLVSSITFIILTFLMSDAVINAIEIAEAGQTKLGIYIGKLAGTHRVIFYYVTRFAFILNAKKLGNLLYRLHFYPTRNGPSLLRNNLKKFDCTIIIISYLCTACATTLYMVISTKIVVQGKTNWMINVLGLRGYAVILAIFGILPITFSDTVALGFIVTIVRAILRIFQEFCEDLESLLLSEDGIVKAEDFIILRNPVEKVLKRDKEGLIDLENEFKNCISFGRRNSQWKYIDGRGQQTSAGGETNGKIRSGSSGRQEILQRFYDLVGIFDSAGEVVGPFVFVTLVITTVELISTVSSVFIIKHQGIFLLHDVVYMIKVAMHMCILQIGHRVQITILKGKCGVRSAFIRASNKHGMRDVVAAVITWNWKLSGLGFFDVDRKLAAGIISLLLSYVVIIFQLQLALAPSAVEF